MNSASIYNECNAEFSFTESSDGEYFNATVIPYSSGDCYINTYYLFNLGDIIDGEQYQALHKQKAFKYYDTSIKQQAAIFSDDALVEMINGNPSNYKDIKDTLLNNSSIEVNSEKDGYISLGISKMNS